MNKKLRKVLIIILISLIIISLLYIIKVAYDIYGAKRQSTLLNDISVNQETFEKGNNVDEEGNNVTEEDSRFVKTERMLKLEELQNENPEIVAWIEIENTNINYPVLQCDNNDFYMNHDYKKDYSLGGAIFLDKSYSWEPQSTNLLIYGHNMINGTMFENLLNYRDINYYYEHPNIRFTTNNEDSQYEIFAVFPSRTYYKHEQNVFRYYYFINANNEEEYNSFVSNAKKASIYDTGKTAQYGDGLITLSTCAYHTTDGKFVVVGRKAVNAVNGDGGF